MSDKKALIVDDEFHIVQVIAIKLRNNGYTVQTAENGQEACKAVSEFKPDVIVTDYQMPVMSGLEFIETIRQNPDTARIPVIMLTARGFAIDESQRERLAISACLSKPFSPREVLQTVEETLKPAAIA